MTQPWPSLLGLRLEGLGRPGAPSMQGQYLPGVPEDRGPTHTAPPTPHPGLTSGPGSRDPYKDVSLNLMPSQFSKFTLHLLACST